MDIEKLIERLRTESLYKDKATLEIMDLCMEAATALSTLQAENEELKEKLYDGEGVNLVNYWMQQAKIEENGHRNCQAALERAREEITRLKHYEDKCHDCPIVCAKTEIIMAHEKLETVQSELEQVQAERDAAISDLEAIMAYGSGNLDTCQFCRNGQCYTRGGNKLCLPEWRGQKEG